MTITIIIIFCSLLLIAYLFDLTASKTKIPSVILLLLLGWGLKQGTDFLGIFLPDLNPILPILGMIGLVVIVLEGSLELQLNFTKTIVITKSFLGALLSLLGSAFVLAYIFQYFGGSSLKDSLINAIPFCIISSAIAIPSVRSLKPLNKEFIIYESSLSDIIGVLLFNFIALNADFDNHAFGNFALKLVIIIFISFAATIMLSVLLSKIEHHIKFVPMILLVILIFALSEIYHLPALVFILLFGLSIGNLDELKRFKWIQQFKPDELNMEVKKFKEILIEAAFLIRTAFFLLFGYLIETAEIINPDTIIWAIVIVFIVFLFRAIQLLISNMPWRPLLFVAPRGLITILLFLSILPEHSIPLVNKSLVIQVIIITSILMMLGLITNNQKAKVENETNIPQTDPIASIDPETDTPD